MVKHVIDSFMFNLDSKVVGIEDNVGCTVIVVDEESS